MAESRVVAAIERLSPAGGLTAGLDLSRPLSSGLVGTIRAAILAHHIVVFPGQSLTREQQFAFAANFGAVEAHGGERGETKRRDVAHVISNLDADGNPTIRISPAANYHWHTDKPYRPAPPALTLLYAVEVPPPEAGAGGDTEFANTALAYDALPEAAKRRIAGLRVAFRPAFDPDRAGGRSSAGAHPSRDRPQGALSRQSRDAHRRPAAGRKAALLAELLEHATQRRFVMPIAGGPAIW